MANMKHAFSAIVSASSTVLILGSMPSEASLLAQQYYAHPRNAFWRILAELTGVAADAAYEQRVHGLSAMGIALWDVLQACEREGSLDSAIITSTSIPNNFSDFFEAFPQIQRIYFNGAKAEQIFRRQVMANQNLPNGLRLLRLPSTSPAHAGMSFERKREAWLAAMAGGLT